MTHSSYLCTDGALPLARKVGEAETIAQREPLLALGELPSPTVTEERVVRSRQPQRGEPLFSASFSASPPSAHPGDPRTEGLLLCKCPLFGLTDKVSRILLELGWELYLLALSSAALGVLITLTHSPSVLITPPRGQFRPLTPPLVNLHYFAANLLISSLSAGDSAKIY